MFKEVITTFKNTSVPKRKTVENKCSVPKRKEKLKKQKQLLKMTSVPKRKSVEK